MAAAERPLVSCGGSKLTECPASALYGSKEVEGPSGGARSEPPLHFAKKTCALDSNEGRPSCSLQEAMDVGDYGHC